MDLTSIEDSIFEDRVAHGYFIMSAAAGLFVDPKQGPVLANYGIDVLRFTKPVYPNTTIYCKLTCQEKMWKEMKEADEIPRGEVKWRVEVFDNEEESVMLATILTLVKRKKKKDDDKIRKLLE
ncbi:MAG: MaoC/PaaZ C-terminal domain-containing protein [Flavobacteriales bacterium]